MFIITMACRCMQIDTSRNLKEAHDLSFNETNNCSKMWSKLLSVPHRHTQVFQMVLKTNKTHMPFDRIQCIALFLTWIFCKGKDCFKHGHRSCWTFDPGQLVGKYQNVGPDLHEAIERASCLTETLSGQVRCPLRNPLLSQLWYTPARMDMDTSPPNYHKKKTFFVFFQVGKWFMTSCY